MRMAVAMATGTVLIMAWLLSLSSGRVTRRGIGMHADHMRPQMQQRRQGHEHPSSAASASCGHACRLPLKLRMSLL
jgi:hypothetical protein